MKAKDLIKRLEDFFPEQEIGVEIHDKTKGVWYVADIKTTTVEVHNNKVLEPSLVFIKGEISDQISQSIKENERPTY